VADVFADALFHVFDGIDDNVEAQIGVHAHLQRRVRYPDPLCLVMVLAWGQDGMELPSLGRRFRSGLAIRWLYRCDDDIGLWQLWGKTH